MEKFLWLLEQVPIPLVLHDRYKIIAYNTAFKDIQPAQEDVPLQDLKQWFLKIKADADFLDAIANGREAKANVESQAKGILRHWSVTSLPLPQTLFSEPAQLTYLQDISAAKNAKSYWDLHLRVSKATMQLLKEIAERKKLEIKTAQLTTQLVDTARQAGMVELATSVLHNIGNILNSVFVSIEMLKENTSNPHFKNLTMVIEMVKEHLADLPYYLLEDPKGKLIPEYLSTLANKLDEERIETEHEIKCLTEQARQIESIVAMQRSLGGISNIAEKIFLPELLDNAIQVCSGSIKKASSEVQKEYNDPLFIVTDKAKVLQIIVNLIQNANDALIANLNDVPKKIVVRIDTHLPESIVKIMICDNGIGIKPEELNKIFSFGFTTKPNGHGFGLHNSSLAAKELGGELQVTSAGIGRGAECTLTLPLLHAEEKFINKLGDA